MPYKLCTHDNNVPIKFHVLYMHVIRFDDMHVHVCVHVHACVHVHVYVSIVPTLTLMAYHHY